MSNVRNKRTRHPLYVRRQRRAALRKATPDKERRGQDYLGALLVIDMETLGRPWGWNEALTAVGFR